MFFYQSIRNEIRKHIVRMKVKDEKGDRLKKGKNS